MGEEKNRNLRGVLANSTEDKTFGLDIGPMSFESSSWFKSTSIGSGSSPLRSIAVYDDVEPDIIPCSVKVLRAYDILSSREFVRSICISALNRLERRQGSFTALMCFDSVIDEHKPLGEPNRQIERG